MNIEFNGWQRAKMDIRMFGLLTKVFSNETILLIKKLLINVHIRMNILLCLINL